MKERREAAREQAMANAQTQIPPQNLEAEESVLGAMMVSEKAVEMVIIDERLPDEDFYRERHRIVYKTIKSLNSRGEPVDALTVTELLTQTGELAEAGGRDAVVQLASTTPAPLNAGHYARIVRQNALLRRLLEAARKIESSVHQREAEPRELVERAESMLFKVAHEERAEDFRDLAEILSREVDRLEKVAKSGNEITGTASGFKDLDTITGGFQPGNLIILAARPSMGKSALMANFCENAALQGEKAVALFSLEMSESELAQRFIASQASIKGDDLRKGNVPASRWPKIMQASARLAGSPLYIDDSSDLSVLDVRAKARRLAQQHADGLGLLVIDYLQLMRTAGNTDNRAEQIGQMSRALRTLARQLSVPVIALSQLNRGVEQRAEKIPMLSDLRESGSIEQDADLVMFIYRDEYYDKESEREGIADLIIAKHRNGGLGTVELTFQKEFPRFMSYVGDDRY